MEPSHLEMLRRQSGLALNRDGAFIYRGALVDNPRVQALFHQGLAVRPDGDVTLTVGAQWAYVACEGVALFVDGLEAESGALVLRLRGRTPVRCSEPHIAFGPDDRVYVWSARDSLPAILTRACHGRLVEQIDAGSDDVPRLRLGEITLPVASLLRAPGPADGFDAMEVV
ncbi:MAG: hypothetical protein R3F39_25940 [Myxococcota bacterium]